LLNFARPETYSAVLSYLAARFGIPEEIFADYGILDAGSNLRLVSASPHLDSLSAIKVEVLGLRLVRKTNKGWKPTSAALQFLAPWISKSVIQLEPAEEIPFLQGRAIERAFEVEPGYVAVQGRTGILGCGLYRPPFLLSQIPASSRAPFFSQEAQE